VYQCVDFAHVLDQLGVESSFRAIGGAGFMLLGSRDIDERDFRVGFLLGRINLSQPIDSRVGDFDYADVGALALAKPGLGGESCQGIEYGCLARASKSDNTDFHR
jgi:hypothetical protein